MKMTLPTVTIISSRVVVMEAGANQKAKEKCQNQAHG